MNREELDWLLQTIKDAETAERFVLAQYERENFLSDDGRCSPRTGMDQPHRESILDDGDPSLD